ncbi:AsmA-like C-terminal region-containing protein [Candidatus Pelagibacter sp.]|nr:AsmA-like C-terminal region-containing protein [Candidatus Pelagibacter sp.]MDC1248159.1 AsmA-like C-terminal region-containing protein [Pelagibacteraceae bacterium]
MIKGIIKTLLTFFLVLILGIGYLSIFGLKTKKFNNQIKKSISEVNNKINFQLNDVKYLLNLKNLSINISTNNSKLSIKDRLIDIKNIKTNISIKTFFDNQFTIDDLQISTAEIEINDLLFFTREVHNSPQLFIISTIIKDGLIEADVIINFDTKGKVKDDYQIKGSIKNARLDLLNQSNINDLNFLFNLNKNQYSLSKIKTYLNEIKLNAPLIEITKKKDLYLIDGIFLTKNQKLDSDDLNFISKDLINLQDIKEIEFSSNNKFSFEINKRFKINKLDIETALDLDKLIFSKKFIDLSAYLKDTKEEISFEKNKIQINYKKEKLKIKGTGSIFLTDKPEQITYDIIKSNDQFSFNTKFNIKDNSLQIVPLKYEKKEDVNSIIIIDGDFKKGNLLKFKTISLEENKNIILINNLKLDKNFKILDIEKVNINYKNKNKILNKFNLRKDNSNFIIKGDNLDLSNLINNIMDSDDENSSIFKNLNSRIDIDIKKTYIDEINHLNNLSGYIILKDNKIDNLILDADFPNNKKISFTVITNEVNEITTSLITDYPKPLIKRYKFIKGFEEGNLNFKSIKKDGASNSVLIIDDFKIQEVPVFAKLLSLASLQGIADILTGEGIRFTDLEMRFSNKKGLTTIDEMYAIGPAVSILMDGYIESKKLVSLRGTLVPATTVNKSIASIPFLGDLLIGDKVGEGVFGVSFKIKGHPENLSTTVNPVKTLTPRFITRTLEKLKKN